MYNIFKIAKRAPKPTVPAADAVSDGVRTADTIERICQLNETLSLIYSALYPEVDSLPFTANAARLEEAMQHVAEVTEVKNFGSPDAFEWADSFWNWARRNRATKRVDLVAELRWILTAADATPEDVLELQALHAEFSKIMYEFTTQANEVSEYLGRFGELNARQLMNLGDDCWMREWDYTIRHDDGVTWLVVSPNIDKFRRISGQLARLTKKCRWHGQDLIMANDFEVASVPLARLSDEAISAFWNM